VRLTGSRRRRRCRRQADQTGTLPVVMAVVFVVVLLSTAMLSRVMGDARNVNQETRMAQARALAQSAVADALFQIDQQGSSPSSFCNEPSSGGACTLSSIPGAPGAVYTARWDAVSGAYTVLARGTSHGVTSAVEATISKTASVSNAVYAGSFVTFNGNSTTHLTVTDEYGNAVPGATAGIAVGPGGTLTCNGPSDPNAVYNNYGGSISNCTPYQNLGPVYDPQEPSATCPAPPNPYGAPATPCMPSSVKACTTMSSAVVGTDATGYVVAGPATLEPGVYVCRGGLTMTGTIDVDYAQSPQQNGGRVEIFVFPTTGLTTSPNITLSGATVNACETTGSTGTGTCSGGIVGDPADLVIYGWGSGTASLGGGSADAVLWAPDMDLLLNGSSSSLTWTGSLVLGGITSNGQPSFNLNLDERLQTEFDQTNWQISEYLPTSPSFTIP
jgi:Tfp pilus assembly protein PilX